MALPPSSGMSQSLNACVDNHSKTTSNAQSVYRIGPRASLHA